MRIIGWNDVYKEQIPDHVEKWYDRYSKCWIVLTKDAEGNQIGDATYAFSKREAELEEKRRLEEIR